MTEIYPPTRKQFSEFLPNHEMVKRFELLFRLVGEDLFDLLSNTEGAQATANDALAQIAELAQELKSNLKTNDALARIEMIKKEYQAYEAALEAKSNYAVDLSTSNQNDLIELEFMMNAV